MLRLNLFITLSLCVLAATTVATSASTVIITVPATAPTESPTYTDDKNFQKAIIDTHNLFRNEHNASALGWNDTLAKFGANWTIACEFNHSHGAYGENLAKGYPNASAAVTAWGDERKKYDFSKAAFSEATGHFTQVVWKTTKTVGCGRKDCGNSSSRSWYVVCEYYPRGNIIDHFAENVQAQTKRPSGHIQGAKNPAVRVRGFGLAETM
ncbi:hypothetical protein GP486_004087, partial [Trichoglossum hirsutum]